MDTMAETLDSNGYHGRRHVLIRKVTAGRTRNRCGTFGVYAAQERPGKLQKAPPGVDTRIHWDNEDEGWIGGSSTGSHQTRQAEDEKKNLLGEKFAEITCWAKSLLICSMILLIPIISKFLGVSAEADMEEIKAAYRRLSKEYLPDTTSLPLKAASDKFMKLRQVYDVLSDEGKRKFYDRTLPQEAASRQAEIMRMRLEDPYQQEVDRYESVPDMVDRLGGRNMSLSDQAMSALTIDIFIILFSNCCIIYVIFFKDPY